MNFFNIIPSCYNKFTGGTFPAGFQKKINISRLPKAFHMYPISFSLMWSFCELIVYFENVIIETMLLHSVLDHNTFD